jgi:hypothetical protein
MTAFVEDYAQARGTALSHLELIETAARARYARAYKARCEHSLDPKAVNRHGSSREDLRNNGQSISGKRRRTPASESGPWPTPPGTGPLIEVQRLRAMQAIDVVGAPAYDPIRTNAASGVMDARLQFGRRRVP